MKPVISSTSEILIQTISARIALVDFNFLFFHLYHLQSRNLVLNHPQQMTGVHNLQLTPKLFEAR